LRNPVYCGETYSYIMRAVGSRREPRPREEWIELPDATPPIITKETFQAAQRQLKMNVGLASRDQKYQWLLRGLVFCRHCERRYCGEPEHKRYRYYRCPGRSRVVSPEPCRNYRVNADWLETIVWNRVKETLQNPDLLLHELKRRREAKTEVKYIEEELQRNQSRLGNLDEAETRAIRLRLYAGRSEEKTLAELQRIYDQRARIEQAIDELEMQMETAKQAEINENGIKRFCEMAAQNIDDFGFVQKRLAMQALQVKIWIDRLTVIIEGLIPIGNFDKVIQQL